MTVVDGVAQIARTVRSLAHLELARHAHLGVVKPGGTLVSVAAFPPFGRKDAREIFFIQESNRAQLAELARLVD